LRRSSRLWLKCEEEEDAIERRLSLNQAWFCDQCLSANFGAHLEPKKKMKMKKMNLKSKKVIKLSEHRALQLQYEIL
jgi:hypothetical protein